jgi:NAD-dependent deacetylase
LTIKGLSVNFNAMNSEPAVREETFKILKNARSVVVLTGAGVSAESGVPTFRGKDGLWKNFRAEELATPSAFLKNPELVWEWYSWRREIIRNISPNPAHHSIAKMEKVFSRFTLITQNVDGLHNRAGNERIIELHGNIWRVRCTKEEKSFWNDKDF